MSGLGEWNDQVNVMKGRGAPGTDGDFETLKKYLIRYYGIDRINSAHGNVTDLAALEKVDGIDKAKLEEQPEALRFD